MALIKSISGIRGTIGGRQGECLTPIDVVRYTAAFAEWIIRSERRKRVVIGRDARISGEILAELVSATLRGMGLDVINLGLVPTPTVELAVIMEQAGGGIVLTASHNPANWNALKLLNEKGEFISDEDGKTIYEIAQFDNYVFAPNKDLGEEYTDDSYIDKHIEKILELPLVDVEAIRRKQFRIIVDAVNSVGGKAVPKLLKALGVLQIEELYCEPNGRFAHNPEPLPENLTVICSKLEMGNYHLGIVVDPDVDRLAFICEDGTPFGEEYTLVAVADYVLQNRPGNTVSNLSSTRALADVTRKYGYEHYQSAVGEVNVVQKMKEVGAVIGGEGNGGVIYPELHYGRDALVGIALFLSHLAKFNGSAKMLRLRYPNYYISKNKIELSPEVDIDHILFKIQERYKQQPQNTIDGLKIEFQKEWVHLRRSNTEPIIRIYAESESVVTADNLAKKLMLDIKEILNEPISLK
ncbi:MAG: phosphoglucosamine mutase [Cytophagales bacterium]|nr:phosphoglucosamine mutase [Cytophagales bacterium]MDW8384832.1 phosphoglucosamine mutase [Flammeovirgaceae bacterium]